MWKMKRVAVIPGDGIGPEVIGVALRVLEAVRYRHGVPLELEELPYGSEHYLKTGTALPPEVRERLGREFDAILLGAVGDPRVPDNTPAREIVLGLRFDLDLFVNLRPFHLLDERLSPLKGKTTADIDFTIVRENTEGIYGGVGGAMRKGTPHEIAVAEMVYTHRGVERIVRWAFEFAHTRGVGKVCCVHKQNAIPAIGNLWLRVFRNVAADYPAIEASDMLVDRAAMEILRAPEQFGVIVTSNLFGDILSDEAAQLIGGIGLAPSANLGVSRAALFEPVHGSAPDIAGQGKANPIGAVLSSALLLEQLGYPEAAESVKSAAAAAVRTNRVTRDLGGSLSTEQVGDFLVHFLDSEHEQGSRDDLTEPGIVDPDPSTPGKEVKL
jgi:3-isopropylmalate dehydrogenase